MRFGFRKFKVYLDSKRFCKACRDIVEKEIKDKDKSGFTDREGFEFNRSQYCGRVGR